MSHGKLGLRALGLAILAALGLMAFMAAGAQAGWLYLLTEGGVTDELASGTNQLVKIEKHTSDGTLLIAGLNVKLLCNKVEGEDILLIGGTSTATGKALFNECVAIEVSSGLERKNCNPLNQPIKAAGKAKMLLHGAKNYVLFEPNTGEPFTEIKFSELCALVETSKITGSLVAECGQLKEVELSGKKLIEFVGEDCKNHQKKPLLQEAPAALFAGTDQLLFGAHVATIHGIVSAEPIGAGPMTGKSWGGHI